MLVRAKISEDELRSAILKVLRNAPQGVQLPVLLRDLVEAVKTALSE